MNTKRALTTLLCTLAIPVFAQQPSKTQLPSKTPAGVEVKEEQPGLRAKAKVAPETAQATALARVPGQVRKAEIEEEHGRLVYSFDIAVKGKPGIEEVQVDALTGEVAAVEHEDEAAEAREKSQEKAEKHPEHGKKQPKTSH